MPHNTVTLDHLAEGTGGTIGPDPRIAAGEITREQVDAFAESLEQNDSLYAAVDGILPHKCVDGRSRADGVNSLGPDAAGGVESMVVGDALTHAQYRDGSDAASVHTTRVAKFWLGKNQQVGGHDADAAHGGSGCGACDKLDRVLHYIAERGDELRSIVASLGVTVDDATQELVMKNAKQLLEQKYADGGPAIIAAMREVAGKDAVETLTGEHKEVAVVINTQTNTTLDRGAICEQFGADLQAFNVDVWALQQSAKTMYDDARKAHALFYATLCYNVAVAAVLSDASLRIVVR